MDKIRAAKPKPHPAENDPEGAARQLSGGQEWNENPHPSYDRRPHETSGSGSGYAHSLSNGQPRLIEASVQ